MKGFARWYRGLLAILVFSLLAAIYWLPRLASSTTASLRMNLPGQAGVAGVVSDPSNPSVTGPILGPRVVPGAYDGDVRDLPFAPPTRQDPRPELELPSEREAGSSWVKQGGVAAQAQTWNAPRAMPTPSQSFAGLDFTTWGSGYPPDTNGDVGPNHYIQTVNSSIGIYTKTTGALAAAFTFNTFFGGAGITGTPCDSNNNGDPVVLYDPVSGRWIITDFAWTDTQNGPYYECIAVSKTTDPVAGGWWMYALRADDASHPWLNDYPKLGVWADGIYMSSNMFDCLNAACNSANYSGVRVWALNRDDLISGAALRSVIFDVSTAYFSLLPSNLRGALPPAGTSNYFVSNDLSVYRLDVFKFHVDWVTPANSTFTGPSTVTQSTYPAPPSTIPENGGNNLDSLQDRLMMQNQYRNLSGVESLWVAHTVGKSAPNIAGPRWYQINVTGGTVVSTTVQQGTYQPDSTHRWIPSLAVDQSGNMAIGYSASSSSLFPEIRYAGRLVTDTLNTLGQGETTLIVGGGAQTNTCGGVPCTRWGDYAAMSVDPVDDCTFWFTTEYYAASGGNWQTRIGSFKYPSCGVGAATATPTATSTATSTATPTSTQTATPTATQTATATATQTATSTATQTATPTATQTATPTATQTVTPTITQTPTATATQTATPTITQTATPTATQTVTPTATQTTTRTVTPSPTATQVFTLIRLYLPVVRR